VSALDVRSNRRARKYSARELMQRVLWAALSPLFRLSPRLAYGWRNGLLRLQGARIGRDVRIHPRARVTYPWMLVIGDETAVAEDVLIYNLGCVTLGRQVTISHGAQLCAGSHDYRRRDLPLLRPPLAIGDGAWVCTEAFVGPGVTVGEMAVIGARAVVIRNVEAAAVVAGNPAHKIGVRELREDS